MITMLVGQLITQNVSVHHFFHTHCFSFALFKIEIQYAVTLKAMAGTSVINVKQINK